MKHLAQVEGRSIVFGLELTQEELDGVASFSDIKYTDPKVLCKVFNESPDLGFAFLRELMYMVVLWNTRDNEGSAAAIEAMKMRGKREPTRRRRKRKVKTRVRRKLQRDS